MRILGTGSFLPKKIVTNAMVSEFLDTSDEWIVTRTGIHSRHVISDESLEDMGTQAALRALQDAGLQASDIDYFVCSNVVSNWVTPSMSCIIAGRIGLQCPCIDINCACPGFIFALDIVENRYKAGNRGKALIVCVESPTRMCDWTDRSTCVLFGDGAGAVVLGEGDNILGVRLNSQPDPTKLWERRPMESTPYFTGDDSQKSLQMRGREVFKFAVGASTTEVEALLSDLSLTKDDVSYYMIHQANLRIIDAIKRFLGEDDSKFPTNIADHGNSSSASCPILLDECNKRGLFKEGDLLVFSAFGAGLLSGAAALRW